MFSRIKCLHNQKRGKFVNGKWHTYGVWDMSMYNDDYEAMFPHTRTFSPEMERIFNNCLIFAHDYDAPCTEVIDYPENIKTIFKDSTLIIWRLTASGKEHLYQYFIRTN